MADEEIENAIICNRHYGEPVEINNTLLNESNYDFVFERMKLEWLSATFAEKAFILFIYKLPDKFRHWLSNRYN
jgi:hypothetical protein